MSGAAALDMSLDDLIKQNKKSGGGGGNSRGRGRASGPGPARRFPNRGSNRPAPYTAPYAAPRAPEAAWQHDMYGQVGFSGPAGGRGGSIETGTKLYISNLEYSVSNEDIKELFSEVGDLKRYAVHYDRSGRSKGTAEVVFSRRQDALAAVKRYNNVQLDGKPMQIEVVGTNIATQAAGTPANGSFGDANRIPRSGQGRGAFGRLRGGGARGGGGGRGPGFKRGGRGSGRGRGEKISADDLDADLEKYHTEAMQTN